MKRLWLIFAQTVTVLLAAYFVVLVMKPAWLAPLAPRTPPATVSVVEAPRAPGAPGATAPGSLSGAVRKAAPAVVSINTSTRQKPRDDPWFRFFFGNQSEQEQAGLGSGVIVSSQGYILTNNHVVADADTIEVVLPDGRHAPASVIGTDPDTDLAVLKINLKPLPVMVLGDSNQLQVGDRVLAIGNPFGVGQTVTSGIVSALRRNHLGLNTFENFIQTDAAINPGNSGGALTDTQGRLMGINTAIYSDTGNNLGIGFAIPVDTAKRVMESIIKTGHVVRGWIGIEPDELTPELAETFGIKSDHGVIVTGVLNNGPAAKAGILPGDVITQIADQPTETVVGLMAQIAALAPGRPVALTLQRRQNTLHVDVTPAQRPTPTNPGGK
jgi:Do/DeqQ family serine protease